MIIIFNDISALHLEKRSLIHSARYEPLWLPLWLPLSSPLWLRAYHSCIALIRIISSKVEDLTISNAFSTATSHRLLISYLPILNERIETLSTCLLDIPFLHKSRKIPYTQYRKKRFFCWPLNSCIGIYPFHLCNPRTYTYYILRMSVCLCVFT